MSVKIQITLEEEEYSALEDLRKERRARSLAGVARELICSSSPIKERLDREV